MNSFVPDAIDHKGDPADRTKRGGWTSAAQILGKFHYFIVRSFFYLCFFSYFPIQFLPSYSLMMVTTFLLIAHISRLFTISLGHKIFLLFFI